MMPELNTMAQNWAVHMARTKRYVHNPKIEDQYPDNWEAIGENIHRGVSPQEVVNGWMRSPGHRANILFDWTYIGIGYARDSTGRLYYTQDFGNFYD